MELVRYLLKLGNQSEHKMSPFGFVIMRNIHWKNWRVP